MFCRFCGTELPDDAVFCSKCGKQIIEAKDSAMDDDVRGEECLEEMIPPEAESLPLLESPAETEKPEPSKKKKLTRGKVLSELFSVIFWVSVGFLALNYMEDQQIQELNTVIEESVQETLVPLKEIGISYSIIIPEYKLPKVTKRSWEEALQADDVASLYYGIASSFGVGEDVKKGKPVKYYLYQVPVEVYADFEGTGETLIGKVIVDVIAAFQGIQYHADVRIWTDTQLSSDLKTTIADIELAKEASCVSIHDVRFEQYRGKNIAVIAYTWTNITDSETSAAYNVDIHAYQNNIELASAYFANENSDLLLRDVKPGVSIELEEVFYLDDLQSDVLVEVTPWITNSGKVYISNTYPCNEAQISHNSTNDIMVSDFAGTYCYDASFDNPDGTWTNFYYELQIMQVIQGVNASLVWRGNHIFNDIYISESTAIEDNTIYFYAEAYQTDYEAGYHSLTYLPADQSPYGIDTIYVDGDTDMPYVKMAY